MLSRFQASYQRVEQSLERLTESIAAYNPSVSAADELVAADEAVNVNLDQLVAHQSNHLRIQELKQTTDALDQTLRRAIQLLADTRREILAIPSSGASEEPKREVRVDELLAYAKFISKTTVPPTPRKQDDAPVAVKQEETTTHITNGVNTPPSGGPDHDHAVFNTMETPGVKLADEDGKSLAAAPKRMLFEPWPSQDLIQRGALAEIQRLLDNGQDPANVLTAEEQAERDLERKNDEEKARLAQEEADRRRMSMFDTGVVRRQTMTDVFDPDNL